MPVRINHSEIIQPGNPFAEATSGMEKYEAAVRKYADAVKQVNPTKSAADYNKYTQAKKKAKTAVDDLTRSEIALKKSMSAKNVQIQRNKVATAANNKE